MALHTYTPTEWKNAPDYKTTPLNATNLNNIETGIENAYTDISTIDGAVAGKAEQDDLTSMSESGATASQAITTGTYFYLNGTLVRAKTDIASGATFTLNTNYEVVTAGALNKNSNLGTPETLTHLQPFSVKRDGIIVYSSRNGTYSQVVIDGVGVKLIYSGNNIDSVEVKRGMVVTASWSGDYITTYYPYV